MHGSKPHQQQGHTERYGEKSNELYPLGQRYGFVASNRVSVLTSLMFVIHQFALYPGNEQGGLTTVWATKSPICMVPHGAYLGEQFLLQSLAIFLVVGKS